MEEMAYEHVIRDNHNEYAQREKNKMAQEILIMAFSNIWALHSANGESF